MEINTPSTKCTIPDTHITCHDKAGTCGEFWWYRASMPFSYIPRLYQYHDRNTHSMLLAVCEGIHLSHVSKKMQVLWGCNVFYDAILENSICQCFLIWNTSEKCSEFANPSLWIDVVLRQHLIISNCKVIYLQIYICALYSDIVKG